MSISETSTANYADSNIVSIDCRVMEIPLLTPFRFATYTLNTLPYTWVRLQTADDRVTYGEAPTYWDPTGETSLGAVGAIEHWKDEGILRQNTRNVGQIRELMESTAGGAYAARCAIEMAILDNLGQTLNKPAVELLGGIRSPVKSHAVIGLPSPESDQDNRLEEVENKVAGGASVVKFKSSAPSYEQDARLIEAVDDRYGNNIVKFVDANQSWGDARSALPKIKKMAELGVDWIEQPINAIDLEDQSYLAENSPIPIMLDESVMDYRSLKNLIYLGIAKSVNLKLAKAGGPFSAMKFIELAEQNNIPYSIGSMVESGLGMLSNFVVAQASAPITCGFDAYTTVDDGLDVGFIREGELFKRRADYESRPGLGYDPVEMKNAFNRGYIVTLQANNER